MPDADAKTVVSAYLDCWNRKDVSGMADLLTPDVRFKGPLSQTAGREAFQAAVTRMLPVLKTITLHHLAADGATAIAVYDFVCRAPIGSCRTAEVLTLTGGKIAASEIVFDPRPFLAPPAASSGAKPAGAP